MSADLFAEFGPFPGSSQQPAKEASNPPQGRSSNASKPQPADDPFAFLATAFPHPTSPNSQQTQQPQTNLQPQAWGDFSTPAQPATTPGGWGDSNWGSLGGLGTTTTATPPPPPPAVSVASPAEANSGGDDGDDDDDAWGDFEDAGPPAPAPITAPAVPAVSASKPMVALPSLATFQASQPPSIPQQQPRTRVTRASTIDLMTNTLVNFGDDPLPRQQLQQPPAAQAVQPQQQSRQWRNAVPQLPEVASPPQEEQKPKKAADPNVLFDAEEYDGTEEFDDEEDDDEFGDFETGHEAVPAPQPPAQSYAPARPVVAPAPAPAPVPAPQTKQAASVASATHLVDLLSLSDSEPYQSPAVAPPASSSSAILSTQPTPSKPPSSSPRKQPPSQLLSPLSFGSTAVASSSPVSGYPQPPKSPSFQQRNPFPGLALATPKSAEFPKDDVATRSPSPTTAWPTVEPSGTGPSKSKGGKALPAVDDWDAWDDVDSTVSKKPAKTTKATTKTATSAKTTAVEKSDPKPASDWDWEAEDAETTAAAASDPLPDALAKGTEAKSIPDTAPPPTNVPPPSILLSVFPSLLALPDEALFKPLAGQSSEARSRILGDPRTIAFLRNYLQLAVVAARVVAGRKQRWHRDKFLAQSMSISVAGSSKGGGMKLAGVDKAQGKREDREAADVVAAWHQHVGKLRSAVVTANAALVAVEAAEHRHQQPLVIPNIQSETMAVTTVKMVPTAPRACVICGLRRDERVRGIDGDDVPDSFGEWWVEHWGHRACKNFWAEHEATLRSR